MNDTTPPTTPGPGQPQDPTPDATSAPASSSDERPASGPAGAETPTPGAATADPAAPGTAGSGPAAPGPAGSGPTGSGPTGSGPAGSGPSGSGPAGAGPAGPGPAGPGPAGFGPAPTPSGAGFFGSIRRFGVVRSDDRWVGGVCAGVAERLGIDPLIVRGLLVVATLLSGVGAVAYALGWALLPERRDGRIHAEELFAGRFDIAILGVAALLVTGLGRGDGWWGVAGPGWAHGVSGVLSGLLWLAFIVAVVIAVPVLISRHRTPSGPPHPGAPHGPATPYGPGAVPPYGTPASSGAARTTPYGPGAPYASATATGPAYATASTAPPSTSSYGAPAQPQAYAGSTYGHPTYGTPPAGAPYGPGPTAYASRPAPTAPPRPQPPRRRGPGATSTGIVVALSLLTLAGLLAAERAGTFDGPVLLTTLGVTAVLAGVGIVVSGLRGRTSGSLGFLAIVALLVSLPAGVTTHRDWTWDDGGIHRADQPVLVTTRADAAEGLHFGAGEAVLDLSDVPVTDELLQIPVSVGAGRVEIVVPEDAAVEATVRVGLGKVVWDVDGAYKSASGVRMDDTTFRDDASEAGGAQLSLDVSVGAGEVTITRENS
ncbi:PspC domain-containing protein [Cellulomonas persica]